MFRILSRANSIHLSSSASFSGRHVLRLKTRRERKFVIYMELWGLVGKLDH